MLDKLLEQLEEKRKQFKAKQEATDIGTLKGLKEMLKKKGQSNGTETTGKGN